MYNQQEIACRIKSTAKSKNIILKNMLSEIELGVNIISQFSKGSEMSYLNLSKIADYLDCSVDYLLGRTDNPTSHKMQTINTVNSNYNAINNSSVTVSPAVLDEHQKLLLELYNKLSPIEQIELLSNLNKQKINAAQKNSDVSLNFDK